MNYIFKKKNKKKNKAMTQSRSLQMDIIKSQYFTVNQPHKECVIACQDSIEIIFYGTFLNKKYKIVKKIYEKSDKATYIIKSNKTNKKYILKIRHTNHSNTFEKNICDILKEKSHDNIIKFADYGIFDNYDDFYYFIYEYFEGMNLYEYFVLHDKMTEMQIKNIFIQIVNAVDFLHLHNIIHCDLKLDNIIINNNNVIKIIDFDLSVISSGDYLSDRIFGTMKYIAPESYDLCVYSRKSDIWQIGVILYILVTGQFPYESDISLVNSYSNMYRQNLFKHIDLSIPQNSIVEKGYDNSMFTLLVKLLAFQDSKRLSIPQILNSVWITRR